VSTDDEHAYGTAELDAPVGRMDFERAIRSLNMADLELREAVLNVAARVVALTDELVRRLDRVEPLPAAPNTPAEVKQGTVELAIERTLGATLETIRAADARIPTRVSIDLGTASKYETPSPDIPCAELVHLCQVRCCTFSFGLSTEDLDEGVIRWDYGQPYLIRQRAGDGFCVHNDPGTHACTVHEFRPRVCRAYDCRDDERIWQDYARRIPASPVLGGIYDDKGRGTSFDLLERAKERARAIGVEQKSISETYSDAAPIRGPKPVK
jgi:Fe-S-cluster containining protein